MRNLNYFFTFTLTLLLKYTTHNISILWARKTITSHYKIVCWRNGCLESIRLLAVLDIIFIFFKSFKIENETEKWVRDNNTTKKTKKQSQSNKLIFNTTRKSHTRRRASDGFLFILFRSFLLFFLSLISVLFRVTMYHN